MTSDNFRWPQMTLDDLMWPYKILTKLKKFIKPIISYVCSKKLTHEIWSLVGSYYVTGHVIKKLITPADSWGSTNP